MKIPLIIRSRSHQMEGISWNLTVPSPAAAYQTSRASSKEKVKDSLEQGPQRRQRPRILRRHRQHARQRTRQPNRRIDPNIKHQVFHSLGPLNPELAAGGRAVREG